MTQEVEHKTARPPQALHPHRCMVILLLLMKMHLTHHSFVVDQSVKPLIQAIYQDIIDEWPGPADTKHFQQYKYHCTNVEGFTPLIQHYVQRHVNQYLNVHPTTALLLRPVYEDLDVRQRSILKLLY